MILDESLFEDEKRTYKGKSYKLRDKLTFDKVCDALLKGVGQNKTKYTIKGNLDPKYTVKIKNTLSSEINPKSGKRGWAEKFIEDSRVLDDAKEYFDERDIETKEIYNGGEKTYSLLVAMPEEMFVESYKEDLTQDMLQDLKDSDINYEKDKEADRQAKVELAKQGIVTESVSKDKLKELANKYNCDVRILDDNGEAFWIEGEPDKREEFFKEYIEISKNLDEDLSVESDLEKLPHVTAAIETSSNTYQLDTEWVSTPRQAHKNYLDIVVASKNKFGDRLESLIYKKDEMRDEGKQVHCILELTLRDNENLKEDLSQEEKSEYGLNTLINSLITDEYEAIDGYNSAIVTLEAEGKSEFTDVIRDIIKDEQNHIGNLQILLKEIQPDVLDNFENGQKEAEEKLDITENTDTDNK